MAIQIQQLQGNLARVLDDARAFQVDEVIRGGFRRTWRLSHWA